MLGTIQEKSNKWTSQMEEPLELCITGLVPTELYTLVLERRAVTKASIIKRKSEAVFRADQLGNVDLSTSELVSGSYEGTEPMGLFWSMEITEKSENKGEHYERLVPHQFDLSVWHEDTEVASRSLTKIWHGKEIKVIPVETGQLIGNYYVQEDSKPRPTVIVVSGSEGGINDFYASILAGYGFHTFAVAYFGVEGLSETLTEIPLEIIEQAIAWLSEREDVKQDWLAIHGVSRGGEVALWSAVLFDKIKAAVSLNGSAISFAGIVPWTDTLALPPAWTYRGEALPYASPVNPVETARHCKSLYLKGENGVGIWYDALYEDGVDKATIPIEETNKAYLLIMGEEDATFDIKRYNARMTKETIRQNVYQGAGHEIGVPHIPIWANKFTGGTKRATYRASVDSLQATVAFLRESAGVNQDETGEPLWSKRK